MGASDTPVPSKDYKNCCCHLLFLREHIWKRLPPPPSSNNGSLILGLCQNIENYVVRVVIKYFHKFVYSVYYRFI